MQHVVIFGAGGHGREVAEVLRLQAYSTNNLSVLGFVVDDPSLHQPVVNELPVLGDWSWFEGKDRNEVAIICAVGLPQVRKYIVERAISSGLSFFRAISPLAYLSPNAKIGDGVMIFPNAFISTECFIGDHTIINAGATISHDSKVERFGTVNPGVHVAGDVVVGEGAYLGVGSSAIHGVSIGAWSTIGAGSVVTCDLPENVTAVGVPSRVIKTKEKGWHVHTAGVAG